MNTAQENALAAVEYAAELENDLGPLPPEADLGLGPLPPRPLKATLKPTPTPVPRPVVDPEQAFGDATRDALYALRDAVVALEVAKSYLTNARVADRLRAVGALDFTRRRLTQLQTNLSHEAELYTMDMFGVAVDLLPKT